MEITENIVNCPMCKKSYEANLCYECPVCMHEWDEGDPAGYEMEQAEREHFNRRHSAAL